MKRAHNYYHIYSPIRQITYKTGVLILPKICQFFLRPSYKAGRIFLMEKYYCTSVFFMEIVINHDVELTD